MPGSFVGHLDAALEEIALLNRALQDVVEVVSGERRPLELRSVGSGSVELFLQVDLVSGATVLGVIKAIVELIKATAQARGHARGLEEEGLPKPTLDDIKAWEKEKIEDELSQLRSGLVKKYPGPDIRTRKRVEQCSLHVLEIFSR